MAGCMADTGGGIHRHQLHRSGQRVQRPRGSGLALGMLLGFAIALAGCGGIESKERAYTLDRAVRTYAHAVRWNKLVEASAYARPRQGELPPYEPAAYEGLNVISNEVSIGALNEELNEASVEMQFGYHWDDSVVIRSMSHPSQWYWDDNDGRWYADSGLPVFPGR